MSHAEALKHLDDLFGYLDWYDATPGAKLRAANVRAMAHKAREALRSDPARDDQDQQHQQHDHQHRGDGTVDVHETGLPDD